MRSTRPTRSEASAPKRLAEDHLWPHDPDATPTGLPLEGLKVLDLSRVLAGPLVGQVAADLGADVIKVEPPTGDPVRGFRPPEVGGEATYYLAVNRNRRSVVADLTTDEGRHLVARLARAADAVVENFLPSQAAAFGIDRLRDELDDVVWLSVVPAASGGPLADQPSFDLLAQARSGLMGVTGTTDSGPLKVGAPLADVVTGLYGAVGLLAALLERQRRPEARARRVEAPLLESTIASLVNQASAHLAAGSEPTRLGNEHPSISPYAPYRASDGNVVVAVGTEPHWRRFVEAIGADGIGADPRFVTNAVRVQHRKELREALEAVLVERTVRHWIDVLEAAGVPCAPVNELPDAFHEPQVAEGDLIVECELASGEVVALVGSPLRIDGVRPPLRRRPPTLGEDTDAVIAALEGA